MLTIACVLKSGGEYKPEHVTALRRSLREYCADFSFLCLTDMDTHIVGFGLTNGLPGWWSKLELFKIQGPLLYFDLDTIIRGDIAPLIEAAAGKEFVCLRDFYRRGSAVGSGLMYWEGDMRWVYDRFMEDTGGNMARFKRGFKWGDQGYLQSVIAEDKRTFWQDIAPGMVCSYKADIRGNRKPSAAPVVCFHGKPRPWQQNEVPYG